MHAFLGGDVPHSILDDKRLGDDEKLKRHLHALNIMAMEGWKVSLRFWEVRLAVEVICALHLHRTKGGSSLPCARPLDTIVATYKKYFL